MEITLQPGEYMLLTTRQMEYPEFTIRLKKDDIQSSMIGVNIFPNPVKNQLNITGKKLQNATLSNVNGRVIQNFNFDKTNHAIINLDHINKGIYFLTITGNSGKIVKKVLKQ
jgi:hypothetical protein